MAPYVLVKTNWNTCLQFQGLHLAVTDSGTLTLLQQPVTDRLIPSDTPLALYCLLVMLVQHLL